MRVCVSVCLCVCFQVGLHVMSGVFEFEVFITHSKRITCAKSLLCMSCSMIHTNFAVKLISLDWMSGMGTHIFIIIGGSGSVLTAQSLPLLTLYLRYAGFVYAKNTKSDATKHVPFAFRQHFI